MLKLDFEKAFDQIEHRVILDIMRQRHWGKMDELDQANLKHWNFFSTSQWCVREKVSL